jgi:hypothetical protein
MCSSLRHGNVREELPTYRHAFLSDTASTSDPHRGACSRRGPERDWDPPTRRRLPPPREDTCLCSSRAMPSLGPGHRGCSNTPQALARFLPSVFCSSVMLGFLLPSSRRWRSALTRCQWRISSCQLRLEPRQPADQALEPETITVIEQDRVIWERLDQVETALPCGGALLDPAGARLGEGRVRRRDIVRNERVNQKSQAMSLRAGQDETVNNHVIRIACRRAHNDGASLPYPQQIAVTHRRNVAALSDVCQ